MPLTKQLSLTLLLTSLVSSFTYAHQSYPPLPEPVTNNAVTQVHTSQGYVILSFMGLGSGKEWTDVHNKVWALYPGESQWRVKSSVPSSLPLKGRLASIAVSIGKTAYLFGGYTVDKDHSEISSPDNFAYDVESDSYRPITSTPVPTDDAVALVYQQRYIYLISGWHNDGNVNLVQVYDVETNHWQQASPYPGQPVFGHAGGIAANTLLVCDGVKVEYYAVKRRGFAPEPACYKGEIDSDNPYKITWFTLKHPTGTARYRMAAAGRESAIPGVFFYGGSDNPYNYNGIGYNKVPSEPNNQLWFYDFNRDQWQTTTLSTSTMDHRGLIITHPNKGLIIGGMGKKQNVLPLVQEITLPSVTKKDN